MTDLKKVIELVEIAFTQIDEPSWDAKYSMADAFLAVGTEEALPSHEELQSLAEEADRLAKTGVDREALLEWYRTALESRT